MKRGTRTGAMGLVAALLLACAGCATDPAAGDAAALERSFFAYHSALRWGTLEEALALHDPAALAARPVTPFELERWKQFRIVGYRDTPPVTLAPGRVQQRVALELVNVNTQGVRNLIDVQVWRYDMAAGRWWLVSGLPDLDAR